MKTTVRQGRSMGSPLRLTLAGTRDDEADAAWRLVQHVFDDTERHLTRFDAMSALSRLNLAVPLDRRVPRTLVRGLAAAWRAYRITRGRFDPRTIGALEEAGERAGVTLPASPGRLGPDDRWLRLDPRRAVAALAAPVDLGGIGKGLALRWAATALRRGGVHDFLLSAGGDVMATGDGPAGRPWIVGVEDPTGGRAPLAAIELRDAALATSSIAVRHWTAADGSSRHHLIDPSTLRPAAAPWLAVTVLAADPAWAEVASKTVFLGGTELPALSAAWRVPAAGRAELPAVTADPARALHAATLTVLHPESPT